MFYLSDGLRVCVVAVIDAYEVALLLDGGAAADGEAAEAAPKASKATFLFINVCLSAQLCIGIVAVADMHVTESTKASTSPRALTRT